MVRLCMLEPSETSNSIVYSLGSSPVEMGGLRLTSRRGVNITRTIEPSATTISATGVISNIPMLCKSGCVSFKSSTNPATTKLVDVPINVHIPPSIDAKDKGISKFRDRDLYSFRPIGHNGHHCRYDCRVVEERGGEDSGGNET